MSTAEKANSTRDVMDSHQRVAVACPSRIMSDADIRPVNNGIARHFQPSANVHVLIVKEVGLIESSDSPKCICGEEHKHTSNPINLLGASVVGIVWSALSSVYEFGREHRWSGVNARAVLNLTGAINDQRAGDSSTSGKQRERIAPESYVWIDDAEVGRIAEVAEYGIVVAPETEAVLVSNYYGSSVSPKRNVVSCVLGDANLHRASAQIVEKYVDERVMPVANNRNRYLHTAKKARNTTKTRTLSMARSNAEIR